MIDFTENIKIEGRYGTWYEIDRAKASDGKEYILFESEQYGDETPCVLCVVPEEKEIVKYVGRKTGKNYVMIPQRFEVEETYDNIQDALEQDLGLDIVGEVAEDYRCDPSRELGESRNSESVLEDEADTIRNFFKRQQLLWDNYPEITDEHFLSNGDYVVELDISNPTYIADTEESLADICEQENIGFDVESVDGEEYKLRYTFYPIRDDEIEIEEGCSRKITEATNGAQWKDDDIVIYKDLEVTFGGFDWNVGEDIFTYFWLGSATNPEVTKQLEDDEVFIEMFVPEDEVEYETEEETFEEPYSMDMNGIVWKTFKDDVKKDVWIDYDHSLDYRFVKHNTRKELTPEEISKRYGLSLDALKGLPDVLKKKAEKEIDKEKYRLIADY